jgi:hypothetical protein
MRHGEPVRVGLGRGESAVREVWQGNVEADDGLGTAAAVRATTGGAGSLVQLPSVGCRRRLRVSGDDEKPGGLDRDEHDRVSGYGLMSEMRAA